MYSVTMEDGTYRYENATFTPIQEIFGYWVAKEEIARDEIEDGMTIGVWTDKDGRLWIDRSYHLSDLVPAIALAQVWNQKAIYDIAKNEAINV